MRVVITGVGMVTSVGRTAGAACSAICAGVSRPRGVCFTVLDGEAQEARLLTGHPIRGYTEGFSGSGLWLRLAHGCLRDLFQSAALPGVANTAFWKSTGLLAVTARPGGARFQMEHEDPTLLDSTFLHPLRTGLGISFDGQFVGVGGTDHGGTAMAFQHAWQLFQRGAERVVIVAVDSNLDSLSLQWLGGADRLKTEDCPSGLMPGEAGVAILLEELQSTRRRGAPALAELAGVALSREPCSFDSGAMSSGSGLAECIRMGLDAARFSPEYAGDVFIDLNGETWRAHEWGTALVRLAGRLGNVLVHLPCTQVGDVGAASGAVGVALAVYSLNRGHARRGDALVVSSSTTGMTGCIALRTTDTPEA